MIDKSLFSSNSSEWETPQALYNKLNKEFRFELDACANENNHKCPIYFNKKQNGLRQDWTIFNAVFMNPPYGKEISEWVKKAYETASIGFSTTIVCLLPARTDTTWWHKYCIGDSSDTVEREIRFIKGRLKFSNSKNSAPFPSAIVIFGNKL